MTAHSYDLQEVDRGIVIVGDAEHILGMLHDMTEYLLHEDVFEQFAYAMQATYNMPDMDPAPMHTNLENLLDRIHDLMSEIIRAGKPDGPEAPVGV